jgi:regulatory protein
MTEEELLKKTSYACSKSEHCKSDIIEKLKRLQTPSDVIERIVSKLVDNGFIDEERFAKAFVRDKYRFNKWGTYKIVQNLRMKQIESDIIDKALQEIDRKEYLENLKNLIHAKQKSIHAKNSFELKNKLIRFALSRGFEQNDILSLFDDFDDSMIRID